MLVQMLKVELVYHIFTWTVTKAPVYQVVVDLTLWSKLPSFQHENGINPLKSSQTQTSNLLSTLFAWSCAPFNMAYPYRSSSRAFRFPQEGPSLTLPKIVEEYHFDGFSSFHDSNSASTTTLTTDSMQVLKLPTRLIIALTCGFAG
jgi:hypothetical protein